MKKIKKVLLLFYVILLTGCSVNYEVTINKDSSVNEKVTAKEYTTTLKINTGLDEQQSVGYLYNIFKREGQDLKVSTINENDYTVSSVVASYDTIDEYINNFSSNIFETSGIEKKGDLVTLSFKQIVPIDKEAISRVIYDDINISIKVPFEVIKHNADSRDGNTYIWKVDEDSGLKEISITYDESKTKDKLDLKLFNISFNLSYQIVAISLIVLVVLIITLIVFINNKKNNRI